MVILIINICKDPLHYYEFVKPIEDILEKRNVKYETRYYQDISVSDIKNAGKAIICGTSLKDNDFLQHMDKFDWLKTFGKPVLGICGGSHILGLLLGKKLRKKQEIGLKKIGIRKEFLGIKGQLDVYCLHKLQVLPMTFHQKNFYATLFHPEVRNQEIVLGFSAV